MVQDREPNKSIIQTYIRIAIVVMIAAVAFLLLWLLFGPKNVRNGSDQQAITATSAEAAVISPDTFNPEEGRATDE